MHRSPGLAVFVQNWMTTYPMEVRKEDREQLYPQHSGQEDGPLRELAAPGSNPDGTTLAPLPPLPPLLRVGMRYHLRPRAAKDEPDVTDLLTLQSRPDSKESL